MAKLEVPNWHLKLQPWRPSPPSLCFHGTRCDHFGDKRELAQELASLEKELKKRLDVHEAVIVTILQRMMDIIDPPALPPPSPKPRIGFRP